jgi:Tfp pilus assembly protein PilF
LLAGGNYTQAAEEFARCGELAPEWVEPKLWRALNYLVRRDFASALELTESVGTSGPPQDGAGLAELLMCRTAALEGLGRTNEATACLESFISQHRDHADVLSAAADLLQQNLQCKGELAVLDELLNREPNNLKLLTRKGWCELQLLGFDAAATTLTRVLSRDPSNADARLHRAAAFFAAGKLEAAHGDYEELRKTGAYSQSVLFVLGAIARRNQDTNAAIEFFQQYRSNSVPGSPEYRAADERLKQLKGNRRG